MLRVAQVITSLARGGAQATVLASARMESAAVAVSVLAGPDDPGEGTYWDDAAAAGIESAVVPNLHRAIDPAEDLRALGWLVRWLMTERPDVVHTHSAKAGIIGRLAASLVGIPVVHTVHGWTAASVGDGPGAGVRRRLMIDAERRMARRSAALVVVTPLDAAEGVRIGIGTIDDYRVIRSGVELSESRQGREDRDMTRRALGLGGAFVVGTVGRLAEQKDLATLISGFAAADLPGGHLVIVGDGPLRPALEEQARRLRVADRVEFLGQRADAAALIGALDVFASTSRWEGLPRTIIEAMAARVPVVATPVGGVAEVVRPGETGTLVPVADQAAVAEALLQQYRSPQGFRVLAERAAEQVEVFAVERMRDDLAALWFEVACRERHPRSPMRS